MHDKFEGAQEKAMEYFKDKYANNTMLFDENSPYGKYLKARGLAPGRRAQTREAFATHMEGRSVPFSWLQPFGGG